MGFGDPSFNIYFDLGSIILLPALLLIHLTTFGPNTESEYLNQLTIWTGIIWIGLFIFCFSVIKWFQGHYRKQGILNFSIYKYSQHPQYLGFLIFSYGLFIRGYFGFDGVGGIYEFGLWEGFFIPLAFIWFLSALFLITVALLESLKMKKLYGKDFEEYKKKTPFMITFLKRTNIL